MYSGTITLWSGSILAIPAGWALCDGNNGTPDLRNKFVVAAGGTFAVGASAGGEIHTHPAPVYFQNGAGAAMQAAGAPNNANLQPPYYALAYIMKL